MKLQARDLEARYGATSVFAGVSLELAVGEVVVVIGPNGAGKSTLLRLLAGISRPAAGAVTLSAPGSAAPPIDLASLPPRERARRIGVLLEAPDATFGFTARELVLLGRYPHLGRMGFASAADLAQADAALGDLRLDPLADRPYPTLSSGERQRVGLARLFCQAPPLMLLDEPTARLDPAHALHVVALLRRTAAEGRAVLAVVHDMDLAAKLADRLIVLAQGRLVASGAPSDVLDPALIQSVWGVPARRVDEGRPAIILDTL